MKHFMLTRDDAAVGEVGSFVVCAKCAEEARRVAAAKAGAEGKDSWLHINRSTCVEFAPCSAAGVVVTVRA